jgi:hypothetical protein
MTNKISILVILIGLLCLISATGCVVINVPESVLLPQTPMNTGSKDVGVTVQPWSNSSGTAGHGVTVLLYGGNDVSNLVSLNVSVDGASSTKAWVSNAWKNQSGVSNPSIGTVYKFAVEPNTELTHCLVVITGNFTDGTTSVLAQTTLTIPTVSKPSNSVPARYAGRLYYE